MKRIILIAVVITTLLSLNACKNEFDFRDSRFGDSIEQVQQTEGEEGEVSELYDYKYLHYDINVHEPYTSKVSYIFTDNKLHHIVESFGYYGMKIEDVYNDIKGSLMKYGSPDEESKEDKMYKAFWEKNEYCIVLLVTDIGVIVTYIPDSSKAKEYYSTYQENVMFDDLFKGSKN